MRPYVRQPQTAAAGRQDAQQRSPRRSAVVILELILTMPVIIIFLLAIVEFGLILALSKHVSYASRFAAKIASEEARTDVNGLGEVNTNAGNSELLTAVDQYLSTAGITGGACQVILQHNVAGVSHPTQTDGPGGCANCTAPLITTLPSADSPPCNSTTLESVRVTVCVPLTGNVPDLLCTFGFSTDDCVMRETTTYRYADCP